MIKKGSKASNIASRVASPLGLVQPQPQCGAGEPVYALGVDPQTGKCHGFYSADRVHTFIAGFPGCGKSVLMLFMALQHVWRGEGCMVMDPHGDLATLFLSHIPRERWDDVVYVDPTTAFKHGLVVQLNFLEYRDESERGIVARSFMDCLAKLYGRFWGPRLDMILLNSLYLLLDSGNARLSELYRVIADQDYRESLIGRVKDERVKSFWLNEYKRMPKDASCSALTKIYRLVQERVAAPMFECDKSSIDLRQLMDQRKILVVNLSEGALTSDLANFLGSLILGKLYLAGMSREDTAEESRVPFFAYIDESPRFATASIRDILQSLRKYRVYMTLSAQYLEQYRRDVALSIPSLCDTIICFSAGENTAKTLEEFYMTSEISYKHIVDLPRYYFAVSTPVKGRRECMVLKTVYYGRGENNPEDVIRHSLNIYGRPVDTSQFTGPPSIGTHPFPELSPVQWLIMVKLHGLYVSRLGAGMCTDGSMPRIELENLTKLLEEEYGIHSPDTIEALRSLCRKGWILEKDREVRWMGVRMPEPPWSTQPVECYRCGCSTHRPYIIADGKVMCQACAEESLAKKERRPIDFVQPTVRVEDATVVNRSRTIKYYALRLVAKNTFFDDVPRGRRGGGDRHTSVIGILADRRRRAGCYCFLDLGEETPRQRTADGEVTYEAKKKPDILVYPLTINEKGKVDPRFWDATHAYVMEVEIKPSKHRSRVAANLEKCRRWGMPTIFATDEPGEARRLTQIIQDQGFQVVRDNLDPFNPKAVTVLYVDPETGMETPVTSPNQPLTTEEVKERTAGGTSAAAEADGEPAKVQGLSENVEAETAAEACDLKTRIAFYAGSNCLFRRRLVEKKWRLIAMKHVGSKIFEADLGSYGEDVEQTLKKLGIEASVEMPTQTKPETKHAVQETPSKHRQAVSTVEAEEASDMKPRKETKTGTHRAERRERKERIKEYAGWGLRIKTVKGKPYLCTKSRRFGRKVLTKSLGPYDEEARKILRELKLKVERLKREETT